MSQKQKYAFTLNWSKFQTKFNAALDLEIQSGEPSRIRAARRLKGAISALSEAKQLRQALINNLNDVSEWQAGIAEYLLAPKKRRGRDLVLEVLVESCRSKWNGVLWFFDSIVIGLNSQERRTVRKILEGIVGRSPIA